MARKKHIHKYHKISLQFGQVWACALPDCNHHMPQNLTPTIIGKHSYCWKCDGVFKLTEDNMKDAQPLCNDCRPSINTIGEFLQKKLGVLVILFAVINSGCSMGIGIRINHAERCEIQRAKMNWIDGSQDEMVLNVCRYGVLGRIPSSDEK